MMELITNQTQGSCSTFSLRPKLWLRGVKCRPSVAFQFVNRTDKLFPLKHQYHNRAKPVCRQQKSTFRISSFKGNAQNGESEGRGSGSKFSKTPLQLSCSQEREETISESPLLQKHAVSYASEDTEGTSAGSQAIQKLFRKWLILLRTQTSNQTMDENLIDAEAPIASSENQITTRKKALKILKAAMVSFLELDPAISLPLLIFIPWCMTCRMVYGAEVTKELTPLWVLGPLIVSLYVKIIQGLCSLYVFCFKEAVRLVKNLPAYSVLVYSYIAEGRLKAFLWSLFCKPIVDIINLDYKELLKQKRKRLEEWAIEKYLDYIESIWPYYCRTIRFLKKANLI